MNSCECNTTVARGLTDSWIGAAHDCASIIPAVESASISESFMAFVIMSSLCWLVVDQDVLRQLQGDIMIA